MLYFMKRTYVADLSLILKKIHRMLRVLLLILLCHNFPPPTPTISWGSLGLQICGPYSTCFLPPATCNMPPVTCHLPRFEKILDPKFFLKPKTFLKLKICFVGTPSMTILDQRLKGPFSFSRRLQPST